MLKLAIRLAGYAIAIGIFASADGRETPPDQEFDVDKEIGAGLPAESEHLLGDMISAEGGGLSVTVTDVSIPGNSALPVAFGRTYSVDGNDHFGNRLGGWNLDVPFITARFATGSYGPYTRCTQTFADGVLQPDGTYEFWSGARMFAPGSGGQLMLENVAGSTAVWGTTPKKTTTDHWKFECLATVQNGPGEGYVATSPSGVKYFFDFIAEFPGGYFPAETPTCPPGNEINCIPDTNEPVPASWVNIFATRVEDPSGNWVRYEYQPDGDLTRIYSNDGREITVQYAPNATQANGIATDRISSVSTNTGRIWQYSYVDPSPFIAGEWRRKLYRATLPDGRYWQYSLPPVYNSGERSYNCENANGFEGVIIDTAQIRHPNGAVGDYEFQYIEHGLNNVSAKLFDGSYHIPFRCYDFDVPSVRVTKSVTKKTLTAPAASAAVWSYWYEQDEGYHNAPNAPSSLDLKKRIVTDPAGHVTHMYYNRRLGAPEEGQLVKSERYVSASGALLERKTYSYYAGPSLGLSRVYSKAVPPRSYSTPVKQVTTERGSDIYTENFAYNLDLASSAYSFGFPISTTKTSSTASGLSRTITTVYAHDKTAWVLGLPSTVTRDGKLFDSFTYDSLGRVTQKRKFGTLVETLTYHTAVGQEGTLATSTDSHGHVYTLSNWKHGRPQTILRPDGVTVSRVVDDNGWVTSETDGRAITTGYAYNSMGWLTLIDRPAPFTDSTFSYSGLGSGVQQTETRGPKKTTITHDGMLRPTLVKTEATDGSAAAVYAKTDYDGLGRTVFQSWPSSSPFPAAGVTTAYDALSRVVSAAETVAPYATTTTAYLSGGVVRVTDPVGAVVTTTSRAFGSPDAAEPMTIVDAMGATTTLARDIYGNVTTLSQSGTQNGFTASVTRQFWYDASLRLCRHRAPEFGDEVFLYDGEGLLTQSGRGEAAASGCVASIGTGIRVARAYDALHRETGVTFPAGTPGVTRSYDASGNLTNVTREGGAVWTYTYNALDAIATEQLAIDGRTYAIGHGYNLNGDLATRSNGHSGINVDYNPDAFGRPRRARVGTTDYVSGAAWHPNGLIAGANYLNGQVLSQTLNERQLPETLKTGKTGVTAVWLAHSYDARRKLASVADYVTTSESRTFAYDANGRLTAATGWWGSGSYVYDALGNIRSRAEGTAGTSTIAYDAAKNRISSATVDGAARAYAYDARGNVASNGPTGFAYDFANQPTALTGTGAAAFAYDGNLKRVKEVRGAKTVYTVYSRATGSLVYRDEATDGRKTDYLSVGAAAVRLVNGVATYTHADAQGTPLAATDAAGAAVWREHYTPFGKGVTRWAFAPGNTDNTGFTGHLEDDASGLVYMQARYYDPLVPRFLSTDPIGYQDQLNLYAYVANDPVNKVDPNGEFGVAGFIYGVISGGVGGYIASGGNLKSVLVGAAVGGAVGAVNPFASSVAGAAAGSAVASVAGQIAGGVVDGQSVGEAVANVDKAAVVGAAVGGGVGRAVGAIAGNATAPIRGSVIGSELGSQTVSRAPGEVVGSIIEGSAAGAGELAGPPVAEAAHQAGTAFFEAVDNAVATEMEHNQQRFDDDLDR